MSNEPKPLYSYSATSFVTLTSDELKTMRDELERLRGIEVAAMFKPKAIELTDEFADDKLRDVLKHAATEAANVYRHLCQDHEDMQQWALFMHMVLTDFYLELQHQMLKAHEDYMLSENGSGDNE